MTIPPSFVVSGTASNSGKTTVTLGLMAAYSQMGYAVQPFKCGPDFIDPGLHGLVTGIVSRNLDLWMAGESFTRQSFVCHSNRADIAIVEGVMGMFDGGLSSSGSLAKTMQIATILVLDVRSMAESAAALVHGFEEFDSEVQIKGVILNRVASPRHLELVTGAIQQYCMAEVLGYLPRSTEFSIPGRHLGLLTADESPISAEAIDTLAETVRQHIDLKRIVELCTPPQISPQKPAGKPSHPSCRIGVARDKAFCFYYQDNLDILKQAGAELIFFSPLADGKLPQGLDGIYLGGGYPELYAAELSANQEMIGAIRRWIEGDGAVYAECGGFMYLCQGITGRDGGYHPLVGAYPIAAKMQEKRASLGYREIETRAACCFGPTGTVLRGHEFHYSTIDQMPETIERCYMVNGSSLEGYRYRRVLGGYLHLHFGYSPQAAEYFITYCLEREDGC
jgi:cobyrinic acid a,c-diamide synthase